MKQLLPTLGLLVFYFTALNAQDYSKKTDSLRKTGNYNLELKYHFLIYKNNPENSENAYNLACCYALLNKIDSSFFYLNESINLGQDDGWVLADCDLFTLHQDNRWKDVENRLMLIFQQKNPTINTQLGWAIAKLFFEDQAPKLASDNILYKYGISSPQMDSINKVINAVDSFNMLRLEAIFNDYGWTSKRLVGAEGADRAFIIILHAPLIYQKKYFEMIQTAVENGDLRKSSLAYLTDKILTKEGKKQIYGTQLKYSYQTKSYQFKPIEDENNVNSRRSQVGLEPIEEYGKNFGINYKN